MNAFASAERRSAGARPRTRELVWGASVGLVLADSSVVTLALPEILRQYDTSVLGVSWVLTVFNVALALVVVPAAALANGSGSRRPAAVWTAGVLAFAGASLACALAPTVTALIVARCAQGVAGACVVAGAIELLARTRGSHRAAAPVWGTAGLIGVAVGPAVGGLLTELISWQSIFLVQVPVAVAVAAAARPAPMTGGAGPRVRLRFAPEVALALLSAGLTGALFLLVVLLTEGWALSPLTAALVVSTIPAATVVTGRLARRAERTTAWIAAGTIAVAAGLAAFAVLPGAAWYWTLAPQVLIGCGIALTLPGLTRRALAGDDPAGRRAAGTIAARHVGIVLGLVVLTPVFSAELPDQQVAAEQSGTALVLEAPLSPGTKIELGDAIADQIERSGGRIPDLGPAFRSVTPAPEARPAFAELERQLEGELDKAATRAFSGVFLLAAGLALLALIPTAVSAAVDRPVRRRTGLAVTAGAVVASGAVLGSYLAAGGAAYEPREVADPCKPRPVEALRAREGGLLERIALSALDGAACRLRVTREELALAVASEEGRREFQRSHRITDAALQDAVRDGARRAISDEQRTGALSGTEAALLNRAVDAVPVTTLLKALRSNQGRSVIEFLMNLLRGGG